MKIPTTRLALTLTAALAANLAATRLAAQASARQVRLSLPLHAGRLTVDLSQDSGKWQIQENTTNTNGTEFAIHAADGELRLSARLFVSPPPTHLTATACRDQVLGLEDYKPSLRKDPTPLISASGAEIARVTQASPATLRAFVASGDLCAELTFSGPSPLAAARIDALLKTIQFDPLTRPAFQDAFAYATTEFDREELEGAVRGYRAALTLAPTTDDPLKWQRVATDRLAESLGMAGDLSGSRAVNAAAIRRDPTYPIYYYSLACADGEESNAKDAQLHLTQAFERRANVLPGETMPDPADDDSFQVLMQDPAFAAFVKTLNASPNPSSQTTP